MTILMCAQKLTDASLIYRTGPKTKTRKMKKLKKKKKMKTYSDTKELVSLFFSLTTGRALSFQSSATNDDILKQIPNGQL